MKAKPRSEYNIWRKMLARCTDASLPDYPRYGGRGIRVCARWKDFFNFLADMGPRPHGMSLDRHPNNDGNYEPGNCRWATDVEQNRNKRNNRLLEFKGVIQCQAAWCEEFGLRSATLARRLESGWPMEKALTTPVRHKSPNRAAICRILPSD